MRRIVYNISEIEPYMEVDSSVFSIFCFLDDGELGRQPMPSGIMPRPMSLV